MQFFSLQLLESCANPSGSKTNIRIEASSEIRTELYKALREVMDIARQGRSQVKSGFFPNTYWTCLRLLKWVSAGRSGLTTHHQIGIRFYSKSSITGTIASKNVKTSWYCEF